ncbi:MAG: penicillin-binding protein 2 [Gammaproteobacteria bacterium]|nr:penicillin-binding protein 2 [Gammaproteobacteria bacterium]
MPGPVTLGDAQRELALFRRRLVIAAVSATLLMLTVAAGLVRLQIVRHEHFRTLSNENRVKVVPIAPTRGLILSRDGVVLAENRPSFSLEIVPERVADLDATIAALRNIVTIDDEDLQRFTKERRKKRRFENVTLRSNLQPDEVARFSVDRHRFPGVQISANLARYYPHGELSAHVVGYVGRIDEDELGYIDASDYSATRHIGKLGIEYSYESELHGHVGFQQVEVNAQGRIIRILERTAPRPGKDLYLTLDASLQAGAAAALADRRGAVVVIDVETGGVLALVSTPSFDPNLFVNGIRTDVYNALRDSLDRPLFNRALQGQYPPGSTIKPLMGLAGLYYGVRSSESDTWCPGWYTLPGDSHRYRDWKKTGHGHVDLRRAIAESCDVYFYRLAQDLGIERMHAFLTRFGLGRQTAIDLPGERSGLVPSSAWKRQARQLPWYLGETLIAGIGQGFMLTTPLQLAAATATLARRGTWVTPHVAGQLEDPVDHDARDLTAGERVQFADVESGHWDTVLEAMHEVVQGPTGTARRSAEGAAYRFAGKTGTSQLFGIKQNESVNEQDVAERLRDHALFIAFAPFEAPEIAVAVVVENGGGGSRTAAPIARQILDQYFSARTIAQTK